MVLESVRQVEQLGSMYISYLRSRWLKESPKWGMILSRQPYTLAPGTCSTAGTRTIRVSLKAPLVMLKLLPPNFLFLLVQFFRFFYWNFWDLFSRSGNFFDCILKKILNEVLIAQIIWDTECNAKNRSPLQSTVLEKIRKNCLKIVKNVSFVKSGQFLVVFLDYFKNGAF